jgi:acetylornithine deacetylase/succinyl-diaminopimelate desuccinylase-like protein
VSSRRALEELAEFIRFPTVSSQPSHAGDIQRCAAWLAAHLVRIGLRNVRVFKTARHPIVYADWMLASQVPTVLIYGHYDVQPADPIDEWNSPPFEPVVRQGNIYGRGACDDKGQMFAHVKALESRLEKRGALPVNVKCLFEGEEEIGSPNLLPFIQRNARALAADVAVMSDTKMLGPNKPAITYSLRGGLSMELEVRGPKIDLHSGNFGGAVHNPLQAVCEIIETLHDADKRISIPGFWRRVRRWPAEERAYMAQVGPSDAKILSDSQARASWGESGFSLYERTTIRPALSVTGIVGGYQGPGVKAVIPSRAVAKLNFRLVPDQRPDDIEQLVQRHMAAIAPRGVDVATRTFVKANPALMDRSHPAMRAAASAYQLGFNATPVFLRSGGTIPVVNMFKEVLGISTVLMGFALPDDRIHAPNEKFHLPNFYKGITTCSAFLEEIARMKKTIGREQ